MTKPQLVPGRNELCVCGSGKKFKKCCGSTVPTLRVDLAALWAAARHAFEKADGTRALMLCEQLLQHEPQHPEALHLRALIAHQQNDAATALTFVQRAIQCAPQSSLFYNSLGFIEAERGQHDAATAAYRQALALDPKNALAHYNLGELCASQRKTAEAEQCYRAALQCQPDFHEAHNNLGLLLYDAQQYAQAITHLAQAIRLRPQAVNAYLGLARALSRLNRFAEVQAVAQEALRHKPDGAESWHYLALGLYGQGNQAGAITAYETALQLNPDFCESHLNLGSIYYEQGLADVARQHFQRAAGVKPLDGFKLRSALCLSAFYDSLAHLKEERERLMAHLDQLEAEPLHVQSPDEEVALTPFFLAYQGENEVGLLSRVGDLLLKSCPALGAVAPHCRQRKLSLERVDIGFISHCFGRPGHVVNRVTMDIIANWPRERFRVTVLSPGEAAPEVVAALRAGDRLIQLPASWAAAQQQIAAAQLDILFYPDLGMDHWTYFLSFARLAPLQLVTSGHPLTSGVPNVDWFLSASNDEVPHAQEHYRERLLCWPERPVCYAPTPLPPQQKTRADFGLTEGGRSYLCPMTPYKLHPANDALFGAILRAEAEGELVFVTNHQTQLWERLKQRFARTMPDVTNRIRYLPHLPRAEFSELLRLSDCVLDTVAFNGGTTSLEAMAVGTPVVTLPGELLRQRGTFALYNRMGLFDCVAKDEAEYVRIATEIARRSDYRAHLKQEILARKEVLFGQTAWIKPLSDWLLEELEKTSSAGAF